MVKRPSLGNIRSSLAAAFYSEPKRFVSANPDRALFIGLFSLLFLFSIYAGYNDLDVLVQLQSRLWVHDYSDMGSSVLIIPNLVEQAANLNPFRLYGVGGGPLRHFIFFPFFAVLQPGMELATKLTNMTTAIFDFVVIPGLLYLLIYRALGRIPAILSVVGMFTIRRGLLYLLSPLGLTNNYLRGPEFYYIGNWQYVYGLVLLLVTLVVLDSYLRSDGTRTDGLGSYWSPVLVGLLLGWTGGSVYVYGLIGAVVVTTVLLYHRHIREWLVVGVTSASFIPLILSYENAVANIANERWTQENAFELFGFPLGMQLDFGPHFELSIFAPLLLAAGLLLLSRRLITRTGVLETLVVVSGLIVGFEAHYLDHLSTYVVVETLVPVMVGSVFVFATTYLPSETYERLNEVPLTPRIAGSAGIAIGAVLAGLMWIVFP